MAPDLVLFAGDHEQGIRMEQVTEEMRVLSATSLPAVVSQTSQLERLEREVLVLQTSMTGVLSQLDALRDKLIEPYNRISQQNLLLQRLKQTCDILRKVGRLQGCSRRILSQTSFDTDTPHGKRELEKSGQALREFDSILVSDALLNHVQEVQRLLAAVNTMRGLIVDKCDEVEAGSES